jgi:uncharacterized protein YbaA (DUF1428 family)
MGGHAKAIAEPDRENSPGLGCRNPFAERPCVRQDQKEDVMAYVDGFVVPVRKDQLDAYKALAHKASEIWLEHGALTYVESVGEDTPYGEVTSFPRAVQLTEDEVVIFSWITYTDRASRDAVMAKVMADERLKADMAEHAVRRQADDLRRLPGLHRTLSTKVASLARRSAERRRKSRQKRRAAARRALCFSICNIVATATRVRRKCDGISMPERCSSAGRHTSVRFMLHCAFLISEGVAASVTGP